MLRKVFSITLVTVVGLLILWFGTDGLKAFTAEKARILELEREQPMLPSATLTDSNGKNLLMEETRGKYVLVTFMYTGCADMCPILETNFAEIYQGIPKELLGEEIMLMSISFNPEKDKPKMLKTYANHFGADEDTWKMVTIQDQQELKNVLDSLEVIVIPDEFGQYEHNAAFYVINPEGRLTNIFDYQTPKKVLDYLDTFLF